MRDEELRALEQAAARGDPDAAERLLGARYRRGELEEGHLDLAAYLGFEPALLLRPEFRPLAELDTQPWVDGLGRFGRAVIGRALLALARDLAPSHTPTTSGQLTLVPLRPSGNPCTLSPGQTVVVGRSRSADLRLDDDRVSRRHCELRLRDDGSLVVSDLSSTNGTFLAGEPLLEETQVPLGQVLRLGSGALLEVRGGLVDPSALERCLAAVQAALDDPRRSTARAAAEVANTLPDQTTPALQAALAAAYAVAGSDALAGTYLKRVPAERCRSSARRALLPWVLSGGPLPPDPPEVETRWQSQRLSNTSWEELRSEVEVSFGVRVWAPLGDCDPRRHAQLVIQGTDQKAEIELLHVVDLQGLDPALLPSLSEWTAISHPNLAAVRRVETRRILAYYPACWCALEAYGGGLQAQAWVERNRPSPREIVQVGAQLADALSPLLEKVERWQLATLTPEDVVVHEGHGFWRGLVARTAVAALDEAQADGFHHREHHIDLRYVTPEQALDAALAEPPQVVVYQLAAILYTLLASKPPFPQLAPPNARVLLEILDRPPESLRSHDPSLDPDLDALLLGCLAKDPSQRPGSPRELAAALRAWLDASPEGTVPPP